ncbi:MAG: 50S ribosomal protein L21 [Succinivibrionaceae bacterium]|jgi:large subunit ribosomal protein L21|nr:50S ribosomal protein L21 [Pseudomonadota bacterium]MDY3145640.1 50S ribosomal protein L21 [Succinivibrionaceae bacterium]MDD6546311.1 50S ribosomal protein L21 [Pseudomonadota bacterium]MDY6275320.1 50S ribosomal protein L21 [Succinivibrionaceae bacterium]MDY6337005.1 50S ribosomal protein L21 [Succinivibrionaceae bacterium]
MYAVIVAGGKQQRVAVDDVIRVEKIESADGHVEFDKVLAVADGANVKLGAPYVDGGKVTAEVVKQGRADKVTITKFRRRKHFQKVTGHRQWFTEVKITGINA